MMLQGPAAYFSSPVYGQSHYKKFWLKKMKTEDDPASPASSDGGSGGVVMNRPSFSVNCSPLELRGTSPPSAAVRSVAAVKSAETKMESELKSELEYTLALGVGVSMEEDEAAETESWEGKVAKFVSQPPNYLVAQPSSSPGFNGNSNGVSPSPSPRGGAATRMCADCRTVKTPLWRNGPQGPKSLCNACGIRYKKMGKRPLTNGGGERLSPPPTPPICPSGKSVTKLNGKRRREADGGARGVKAARDQHHHRKKIKALGGLERFRNGGDLQSNSSSQMESPDFRSDGFYSGGGGDGSMAAQRRWSEVERIRKGLLRYGKLRSMAKDEEEAAVLLMAMSCGGASCC